MSDPDDSKPPVIVVGVSDPSGSQEPLRWAAEQARAFGKTLLAVTAIPAPHVEPWPGTPRGDHEEDARARALLDEAVDRLGSARRGIELRKVVREGPAARALIDESRQADLLVLGGRRARGRFTQRPLSVAAQCIQLAACPVVVVPTPREAYTRQRERS